MIIVRLMGGLGNQMFQYALGQSLAARTGAVVKYDLSQYKAKLPGITNWPYRLNQWQTEVEEANPLELFRFATGPGRLWRVVSGAARRAGFSKYLGVYDERGLPFDPAVLELGDGHYLSGYWQSERYFAGIADKLRHDLQPANLETVLAKPIAQEIARSANAVSLHVRRGDYVSWQAANQFHGTCTADYYDRAQVAVADRLGAEPHFFVFSDDVSWARDNLTLNGPASFVSGGDLEEYEEMYLMSRCRHHIIANSSFSWWGAWLNPSPDKLIVAPKQWFRDPSVDTSDVVPESWIKI
jgi:hypothetical protein